MLNRLLKNLYTNWLLSFIIYVIIFTMAGVVLPNIGECTIYTPFTVVLFFVIGVSVMEWFEKKYLELNKPQNREVQ